jgi:hypothetical protein
MLLRLSQRMMPDPELERRAVRAPELRIAGVQREAPATKVATM